jgi:hypothetical protein
MKKERGAGTSICESVSISHQADHLVARWAYLELVLAGLGGRARVEEINCENLETNIHQHMPQPIKASSCPLMSVSLHIDPYLVVARIIAKSTIFDLDFRPLSSVSLMQSS